jgi:hypothetical protein
MSARPTSSRPVRIRMSGGRSNIVRLGHRRPLVHDLYHLLLTRSWLVLFVIVAVAFIVINSLFALLYLARGGAIANARPGSFADAFFFAKFAQPTARVCPMVGVRSITLDFTK